MGVNRYPIYNSFAETQLRPSENIMKHEGKEKNILFVTNKLYTMSSFALLKKLNVLRGFAQVLPVPILDMCKCKTEILRSQYEPAHKGRKPALVRVNFCLQVLNGFSQHPSGECWSLDMIRVSW